MKVLIQERKIRIKYLCNADGALHLKRQIEIGQINLKIFFEKKIYQEFGRENSITPAHCDYYTIFVLPLIFFVSFIA